MDFFLHLDRHLTTITAEYGTWTYLILFLIVFAETGLVVTPFLPGDSLLFAAGTLAGLGKLNVAWVAAIFACAALTGDNVNYFVGKFLGPRLLRSERSRLLNRSHLARTHAFFERHGGKTIILARFVPIVRTFTPFVAGIGAMTYPQFLAYSVVGAQLWVGVCVFAGYFFGALPIVKQNFSLVVLAIVAVSVLPAAVEVLRHRRRQAAPVPAESPSGSAAE